MLKTGKSSTKPKIKVGSTVLVPRTGGYKCLGIVKNLIDPMAEVVFPVGPALRGQDHNYDPSEWASKTVDLEKLELVRP